MMLKCSTHVRTRQQAGENAPQLTRTNEVKQRRDSRVYCINAVHQVTRDHGFCPDSWLRSPGSTSHVFRGEFQPAEILDVNRPLVLLVANTMGAQQNHFTLSSTVHRGQLEEGAACSPEIYRPVDSVMGVFSLWLSRYKSACTHYG